MERLYLRLKHVIFEVFSLRMVWVWMYWFFFEEVGSWVKNSVWSVLVILKFDYGIRVEVRLIICGSFRGIICEVLVLIYFNTLYILNDLGEGMRKGSLSERDDEECGYLKDNVFCVTLLFHCHAVVS
jgi:hypothetical protein